MYSQNSINILPVSNGFVVTIPQTQTEGFPISEITGMFGKMADNIGKDPIIRKMEADLHEQVQQAKNLVIPRDEYTHVFKTFKEALAFLDVTYSDGFEQPKQ